MDKESHVIFNNQADEPHHPHQTHAHAPQTHHPIVFNQGKHLELMEAIKAEDLQRATDVLNSVSNPEHLLNLADQSTFHQSAIYKAVMMSSEATALEFCKLFVSKRAGILGKDAYNQSPLFYICKEGRISLLAFFLENKADINETDQFRQTPLFYASRDGKTDMVRYMIDRRANPNHRDKAEQTPLFYASRDNRLDTCRVLIEKGADVNAIDSKKQTALFYAKKHGNKEVEDFLIASGAINTKDGIVRPSDIRRPPRAGDLTSPHRQHRYYFRVQPPPGAQVGRRQQEKVQGRRPERAQDRLPPPIYGPTAAVLGPG